MEYKIISSDVNNFFVEIKDETFDTKILFNYTPESNFLGLAVGCNYSYKGNPIGYLKDNGLLLTKIPGHVCRPLFAFDNTVIQAGPTLLENFEPQFDWKKEKFNAQDIVSGFHAHVGQKKSGNYVFGMTTKLSFQKIIQEYQSHNVQNAIKLPGLNKGSFYFKSRDYLIKEGLFPIPVALVIEHS